MPKLPRATLLASGAFLAAGAASALVAGVLVSEVEGRSVVAVREALADGGHDWASVLGDGLQVVIEGEAPSEAMRFRAISVAGGVVDASRVIDNMRVTPAQELAPPEFSVEILRNDAGVSLVGLIPAGADRATLAAEASEAAAGEPVTDLLQVADHPVPDRWEPALAFALDALELLPRARVSVAAGQVSIDAIADSPEEQARLRTALVRLKPDGVQLALDVEAPRPVVTPFTLRATLGADGLALDACVADTEEARRAILAAAAEAGAEAPLDCRLALGSPSPDWGRAAAAGLAALGELGGGTLAFSDADVALVAAPGTDRALFDRVAGELQGALPDLFSLAADLPEAAEALPAGPLEFRATLSAEGARLQGRLPDPRIVETARTIAEARFGTGRVTMATRVAAEGLPEGWSMRVLAGLDALGRLEEGEVRVTADAIAVSGRTGDAGARDAIAAGLLEALGPEADLTLDVAYDESLDPLAALPSPEECLAEIQAVTAAAKVTFDPGSTTLSPEGREVVGRVADILRPCGEIRLRIAGYTDSQGRESSNLALSQDRAEAVLEALREDRVPVLGFEAVGFGEESPIADNDTEAGREANRRIEFSLAGAEAAPAEDGEGEGEGGAAAAGGEASADEAAEAAVDGDGSGG